MDIASSRVSDRPGATGPLGKSEIADSRSGGRPLVKPPAAYWRSAVAVHSLGVMRIEISFSSIEVVV